MLLTAKEFQKIKIIGPPLFQMIVAWADEISSNYITCYLRIRRIFDKVNSIPVPSSVQSTCTIDFNPFVEICKDDFSIYATNGLIGLGRSGFALLKYPLALLGKF